jgi:hypothetical protein
MADVTISQLTQGTPNGNHLLPYSTGNSTLGTSVSAIFENTNNVGIGSVALSQKGNLQIRNGSGNSGDLIVGNMCRVGGNINQGFVDFNTYYDPTIQNARALNSNRFAGLLSFNAVDGIVDFRITSNQQTADTTITNLYSRMSIDSQGRVTKPFQPAFAVRANAQSVTQNSANPYPRITLTNEIFNIGNYWNSSLSQFVAPVAGVYSFSGMIRLNTFPGSYFYPTISINGIQYIDKYAVAGNGPLPGLVWTGGLTPTGSFVTTNWHQLIKLDAGDVIALNFRAVNDNTTYNIDYQTVFYGYLLG